VLKGHNDMRVFQEEIFGPVLAATTFTDEADAVRIANDTLYGLGLACGPQREPCLPYGPRHKADECGRTATPVPRRGGLRRLQDLGRRPGEPPDDAGALLQTKNLLVSYSTKPLGLF